MAIYGFHASHEQQPPSELLAATKAAEAAGFEGGMCSDHFAPWSERQGHSGFAWSWLGAALEATNLSMGVVNAPGQRYHPAVIAQAAATLAEMYPGRFWLALGSGEAMNEHITGDRWPPKQQRNARLKECADVIRALFKGETVSHHGLVTVDRAKLWSLPAELPPLVGAAVSAETAGWLGGWADALITTNQPIETLREVIDAFREGGGEGKPLLLQVHVSWAADDAEAERIALAQWRNNVLGPPVMWDLETPEHFDKVGSFVGIDDVKKGVFISSDAGAHAGWLHSFEELGFERIYVHHVGQEQRPFLDTYGEHVLPRLKG
jgi:probable non-F420 flavinoid oxidoreductase